MTVSYEPGKGFATISITGKHCALSCRHCSGIYLRGMLPATDPKALKSLAMDLESKGHSGMLISGGCDISGRVPIKRFLDAIRWIKDHTGLLVNVHTGLIYQREEAEGLFAAGVDAVSYDLVGLEWVVRAGYGLGVPEGAHKYALRMLIDAGLRVYPHINIGLYNGILSHEFAAIDAIAAMVKDGLYPGGVVFIVLIPTPGTPMAYAPVIDVKSIERVFNYANVNLSTTKRILGCMRPKPTKAYAFATEMAAYSSGIRAIVLPTRDFRTYLNKGRKSHLIMDTCCVFGPERVER